MKKTCSKCCLCNPVVALWMLRMIVGIIFVFAGVGKLTNMEVFSGAVSSFGYPEMLVAPVAWFVALAELIGGIALLAGKFIPKCTSKMLMALLFPVMAGVIYHVDITNILKGGNPMGLFMNLQLILAVYVFMCVSPTCPLGISGSKTMDGGCAVKTAKKK